MVFTNRDAEYAFLPIADMMLRTGATIIWEHGTDARCIPHWKEMAETGRFFVTLTAHHLDDTFGDVRSTCKPSIKTEYDRRGLIILVSENHRWVMAGLDDAPHPAGSKHVHIGKCACGAYTAPFGLQLYAQVLLPVLLPKIAGVQIFVNFTSGNAREVYGLPPASKEEALVHAPEFFHIPDSYQIGDWEVEPFWAGQKLDWTLVD